MVYAQSRICPQKRDEQNSLGFGIQTDHIISARRPNLVMVNQSLSLSLEPFFSWLSNVNNFFPVL